MLKLTYTLLFSLILSFKSFKSYSNDENILNSKVFKSSLKKWGIDYDNLEDNKAGAACIPNNSKNVHRFEALGFSHQMYNIKMAKRIALAGCSEMKKKEILSNCSCEVIIVNNKIKGGR